ncbi:DUF2163 domain-containing protein [Crenothrix polyspora]|uniref:Bacteriophage phiJL001 Gp84 C-terminal domain-containing protein n=1 Tax=Crenothrix polyspora TaxID=360316 RepID=A0A1R4HIE9_9GAMM|nr:DUF2163 domain-containing protein [Crenothrix polyspora]SJM96012.1 conserved hypothetical protein [Crenothrix polyspora]
MKTLLSGSAALPIGMVAELYTISSPTLPPLFLTTADVDIDFNGHRYKAGLANLERSAMTCSVGINVDEVTVTLYQHANNVFSGIPLPVFALNGGFDGAKVVIYRTRRDYTVHLFEGIVSDVSYDRTRVELTLSALVLLLNVPMPRNVYTSGCVNELFDSGCGVSKAEFSYYDVIEAGTTKRLLRCSASTGSDTYFDLGMVTFTSGLNNGARRTIKRYSAGRIELSLELDHLPTVGDAFIAYPGCPKTRAICQSVFNNDNKFRGFPYIPSPEASV